jgi:hypothetical protein
MINEVERLGATLLCGGGWMKVLIGYAPEDEHLARGLGGALERLGHDVLNLRRFLLVGSAVARQSGPRT